MAVTLKDVADTARVTKMTLARYFREPHKVAPPTRDRIRAAIEALGYVRDAGAASLSGAAAPGIAVIVPDLSHPYATEVLRGVTDVTSEMPHPRRPVSVYETRFDPARQEDQVEAALSWRPAGLVYLGGPLSALSRRMIGATEVKFVEAWGGIVTPDLPHLGASDSEAARLVTAGLFNAGYRRIVFALRRQGYPTEDARLEGYRTALEAANVEPNVIEDTAEGSSYEAGARLLDRSEGDVVLFAGDLLAIGAIAHATAKGLRVPDDIAICGIGGYEVSGYTSPTLSTVAIPHREAGRAAALSILGAKGSDLPANRLVERSSARLSRG